MYGAHNREAYGSRPKASEGIWARFNRLDIPWIVVNAIDPRRARMSC